MFLKVCGKRNMCQIMNNDLFKNERKKKYSEKDKSQILGRASGLSLWYFARTAGGAMHTDIRFLLLALVCFILLSCKGKGKIKQAFAQLAAL